MNTQTEATYGLQVNAEGYAVVTWRTDEGEDASAELDPNSADVRDALATIRKIIWGA